MHHFLVLLLASFVTASNDTPPAVTTVQPKEADLLPKYFSIFGKEVNEAIINGLEVDIQKFIDDDGIDLASELQDAILILGGQNQLRQFGRVSDDPRITNDTYFKLFSVVTFFGHLDFLKAILELERVYLDFISTSSYVWRILLFERLEILKWLLGNDQVSKAKLAGQVIISATDTELKKHKTLEFILEFCKATFVGAERLYIVDQCLTALKGSIPAGNELLIKPLLDYIGNHQLEKLSEHLLLASTHGNKAVVCLFIDHFSMHGYTFDEYCKIAIKAASFQHFQLAEFISGLSKGCAESRLYKGQMMHIAAVSGNMPVFQRYLNPTFRTRLMSLVTANNSHFDIVRIFMRHPEFEHDFHLFLRTAAFHGTEDIVKACLAKPDILLEHEAIKFAVRGGHLGTFKLLLEDGRFPLSDDLLIIASKNGNQRITSLLLQDSRTTLMSNIHEVITKALTIGMQLGHEEIVKTFMMHGRTSLLELENILIENIPLVTPSMLLWVLKEFCLDPSLQSNAIFKKSVEFGSLELTKVCLANLNLDPSFGSNELIIIAADKGHTEIVKLLLDDPRVDHMAQNESAIFSAAKQCHLGAFRLLADKGVTAYALTTSFQISAYSLCFPIVQYALENYSMPKLVTSDEENISTSGPAAFRKRVVRALKDSGTFNLLAVKSKENWEFLKLLDTYSYLNNDYSKGFKVLCEFIVVQSEKHFDVDFLIHAHTKYLTSEINRNEQKFDNVVCECFQSSGEGCMVSSKILNKLAQQVFILDFSRKY